LKRELRQSNIIYNREIGEIKGIRGKKKKKTKIPKKTFSLAEGFLIVNFK